MTARFNELATRVIPASAAAAELSVTRHIQTGASGDLGNAGAHETTADNSNFLDHVRHVSDANRRLARSR